MVFSLLGWLILSIVVATYASKKGKSGILYFFISIFLSPILGFLIAFISGDNEEGLINSGQRKKCPNCGELIRPEAKVCKFCNTEIQDSVRNNLIKEKYSNNVNILELKKNEMVDYQKIKNQIVEFCKKEKLSNIKIDNEKVFLAKNEDETSFLQLEDRVNVILLSISNFKKPDFIYDLYENR